VVLGVRSILVRQEQRRRRAIGLGDHPQPRAVGERVRGQQTEALTQRQLVFDGVLEVEVAPVADDVAAQIGPNARAGAPDRVERAGRGDDVTEIEEGRWWDATSGDGAAGSSLSTSSLGKVRNTRPGSGSSGGAGKKNSAMGRW
jgi:hypothetical protein